MIEYRPTGGPLHRAHPLTALSIALAVMVLSFALPAPSGPVGLALLGTALPLVERVPYVYKPAILLLLPIWFFAFVIHAVLGSDPGSAITVSARFHAMILVFMTTIASIDPAALTEGLIAKGFPFWLAYSLAATLQAIPRLRDIARDILDAQRSRGLKVTGSIVTRARALVPLAIPLVLSVIMELEQRSIALDTRGAGSGHRRTVLDPPPDSLPQSLFRWGVIAGVLTFAAIRFLAGS